MSKHAFCGVLKQAGLLIAPKKKDSDQQAASSKKTDKNDSVNAAAKD